MKYVIDGTKESAGHDNSKPWYLLGIVSFGACGKGNPGIFTRCEIVIQHLNVSTSFIPPGWRVSYHGSRRISVTKSSAFISRRMTKICIYFDIDTNMDLSKTSNLQSI